jgi:hypothetical protein
MGLTENTATTLPALNSLDVRPNSAVCVEGTEAGLVGSGQRVAVLAPSGSQVPSNFEGESSVAGGRTLVIGPMNAANLDALRAAGGELAPIFAQQSIREMERTGRSPQEVLDDATWGVFAEGWMEDFGADADHLKTTEDVDACVAAGYTFFTFDPGEYVDDGAEAASASALRAALEDLPWQDLEDLPALLERFDEREILHVTFGSVLKEARFRDRLLGLVRDHPDHYAAGLEEHFLRQAGRDGPDRRCGRRGGHRHGARVRLRARKEGLWVPERARE